MTSIFRTFEQILKDSEDYISHDAGLFCNGLIADLPQKIVIVTSSRRRDRVCDGYQIEFVYHHPTRPRETQKINIQGAGIRIAKLSQALVDIVADSRQIESLEALADLFWRLPFNVAETVELAEKTSNTAYKRIMFWALWAGRLRFPSLPHKLDRTPVNLFQNDKDTQLWEGTLQVFYPKRLLGITCSSSDVSLPDDLADWVRLRCNQRFAAFAMRSEWLPIAGDTRKKPLDLLESFFVAELAEVVADDLTGLLERMHRQPSDPESSMSQQFINWVRESSRFADCVGKKLKTWVRDSLRANDPRHWEIAFFYAPLTGRVGEAFSRIADSAAEIFNSGRFRGLIELCRHAEDCGIETPRAVRILLSRILARLNRCDEALAELEKASAGVMTEREAVDVAYAAGVINRQAGRLDEAVRLLNEAASRAASAAMRDSAAAILNAVGNVHLARGELTQARKSYLKAAANFSRDREKPIVANIQTNLGFVEFRSGNLKKADCCFSLAARNQKMRNNLQGEITSGIMLGRIRLARGHALPAIEKLLEVERLLSQMAASPDRREVQTIIAWAYELLGRPVLSDQYWKKAEEAETEAVTPAAEFMIRLLKALHNLIRGELAAAESQFAETAGFGRMSNLQAADVAVAEFYQALGMHLQKKTEALQLFRQLPAMFFESSDQPFHLFVKVFLGLTFPGAFPEIDIDASLSRLNLTDYYEPVWMFVADQLYSYGSAAAIELVKSHIDKLQPDLKALLEQRFPAVQKFFKKLRSTKYARKNYTLIRNGRHSVVNEQHYQNFESEIHRGTLVFNGVTGKLAFSKRAISIKPGSILHRILACLLSAFPEDVPLGALYETVWGGKYEPEYGSMAVKAAMLRLRKIVQKVCPTARIEGFGAEGRIRLILESPFAAIL
ncbi:MAG: hypothetical protein CVV41_21135 [Candidatus Riflebacteria bacterium HGW-Riflebacteria-1]|nr:MAG: hypothetical protein CVV41_21135 [Candidatus Riflebacteria bacterium HGW-Riflebacteria-1]